MEFFDFTELGIAQKVGQANITSQDEVHVSNVLLFYKTVVVLGRPQNDEKFKLIVI